MWSINSNKNVTFLLEDNSIKIIRQFTDNGRKFASINLNIGYSVLGLVHFTIYRNIKNLLDRTIE